MIGFDQRPTDGHVRRRESTASAIRPGTPRGPPVRDRRTASGDAARLHGRRSDDRLASSSISAAGQVSQVTGQVSGAGSAGTVDDHRPTSDGASPARPLAADRPAGDPGDLVVVGLRPAIRSCAATRRLHIAPARSGADESLAARWSGRIGTESAARDAMRPCTHHGHDATADVCQVIVPMRATARDGGDPASVARDGDVRSLPGRTAASRRSRSTPARPTSS